MIKTEKENDGGKQMLKNMKRIDKERIYKKAMYKWGFPSQVMILMEEAGELIQAASKLCRKKEGTYNKKIVFLEEIADMEIMIEQFKFFFQAHKIVDQIKEKKLKRLKKLLGE